MKLSVEQTLFCPMGLMGRKFQFIDHTIVLLSQLFLIPLNLHYLCKYAIVVSFMLQFSLCFNLVNDFSVLTAGRSVTDLLVSTEMMEFPMIVCIDTNKQLPFLSLLLCGIAVAIVRYQVQSGFGWLFREGATSELQSLFMSTLQQSLLHPAQM